MYRKTATASRGKGHLTFAEPGESNLEIKNRLACIVQHSDDAIIGKNLKGIITDWNTAAEKIFGYTVSEALGKHISLIIPQELREEETTIIKNLKKGKHIEHFETVRVRKDGRRIDVSLTISPIKNKDGIITGASKIARDITQSREIERKLRFQASILENISDAVITTDLNYMITGWNKGATLIYGWDENEATGKEIFGVIPPEYTTDATLVSAWLHAIRENGAWHGEARQYRKDGSPINTLISASHIKDGKGASSGFVFVCKDISDRIKLEKRKDDFIALASHELRTPVTSLKMYIQILLNCVQKGKKESVRTFLSKMNIQTEKLNRLVQDLLDTSRVQVGKLQYKKNEFSLVSFLRETIEDLSSISPQTLMLHPVPSVRVWGDKGRIRQVLTNLVSNAIRYSPKTSTIHVEAYKNRSSVIISVKDTGVGIPKGQQKKIFERFYQAHTKEGQTYPGLGLGLYLSKEIVARHNGVMWLESAPGRGSTFYFSLPIRRKKTS